MTQRDLLDEVRAAIQEQMPDADSEKVADAANAAVWVLTTNLHAMLYPERHPGYDPDHMFWHDFGREYIAHWDPENPPEAFEWPIDIGEWCGDWATKLREQVRKGTDA